jgi:hypothetical protein
MARRAGKAASRKARQRRVQRQGVTPSPPAAPPLSDVPPAAEPRGPAPSTARRAPQLGRQAVGSALTATERSEYHYVERDLRDIAILSVAMAALLGLAWFAVRSLGIVG